MPTLMSQTLAISIERPWQEVYDYASDPKNLTHWAAGLGSNFEHDGEKWTFHQGGKPVTMTFADRNTFGVLDHDVHVGDQIIHNALRVMPNGDGAEVTFLLLQAPGVSAADLEKDAAAVRKDLQTLKGILEA